MKSLKVSTLQASAVVIGTIYSPQFVFVGSCPWHPVTVSTSCASAVVGGFPFTVSSLCASAAVLGTSLFFLQSSHCVRLQLSLAPFYSQQFVCLVSRPRDRLLSRTLCASAVVIGALLQSAMGSCPWHLFTVITICDSAVILGTLLQSAVRAPW